LLSQALFNDGVDLLIAERGLEFVSRLLAGGDALLELGGGGLDGRARAEHGAEREDGAGDDQAGAGAGGDAVRDLHRVEWHSSFGWERGAFERSGGAARWAHTGDLPSETRLGVSRESTSGSPTGPPPECRRRPTSSPNGVPLRRADLRKQAGDSHGTASAVCLWRDLLQHSPVFEPQFSLHRGTTEEVPVVTDHQ